MGESRITHSPTDIFPGGKSTTCNEDYSQILVFLLLNGPPNLTLPENDPIRSSDINHVL